MDGAADEAAERVLERLARIRELNEGDHPLLLLDELRELVGEAEEWSRLEGDERARAAAAGLGAALGGREEVRGEELSLH
jgi:hypothetical protein